MDCLPSPPSEVTLADYERRYELFERNAAALSDWHTKRARGQVYTDAYSTGTRSCLDSIWRRKIEQARHWLVYGRPLPVTRQAVLYDAFTRHAHGQ